MPSCVAYGCTNRSSKKIPGITFHRFPKNTPLREAWVKACRRENWTPTEWSHLCCEHFSEEQIDRTSLSCVRLRENAVPTVFKGFPPYLQKTKANRKPPMKREAPVMQGKSEEAMVLDDESTVSTPNHQTCDAATSPIKLNTTDKIARRSIEEYEAMILQLRKKIKMLTQRDRRSKIKIEKITSLFDDLKQKQFMDNDVLQILKTMAGPNQELLTRQVSKLKNESLPKAYSPELRAFALTLHFYSPRAYDYVRETFQTFLPHSRTISKWYQKINAAPGFTLEAFKALGEKVKSFPGLLFALVYDEMAIMQHVEFDGKVFHGYVDLGTEAGDDLLPVAKEALVFMVVCINDRWKVPIGYFLTDGMNALHRANLVNQCLSLLHQENVRVVSLTFDGLPANFSAASHLGCNFAPDSLSTKFKHPESDEYISVLLDPCHMLKCVRNALGDKKSMVDGENNFIEWKYIEQLHQLQENEGLNLANKLRGSHIKFYKQKMKVRLAAQTFSKSVSDAIRFCKDELTLPEFVGCEGTVKFINTFNDLFDILNSRSRMQQGFKKPISETSFVKVDQRLNEIEKYISSLKVSKNGERIVDTNRKTGFVGFLVCINSVRDLFRLLVQTEKLLKYLPVYKLSQDHIELFFQSIRSQGGCSNNPTARQFKSAYKKLLINSELKSTSTGNCVPLESLSILSVTSSFEPENVINNSSGKYSIMDDKEVTKCVLDHDYIFDAGSLTAFSEHIVYYIAGFVVRKLSERVKCDLCIGALYSSRPHVSHSLISYKTRGGLIYPSDDVFKICKSAEAVFRRNVQTDGGSFLKKKHGLLQTELAVLGTLISETLFSDLAEHVYDHEPFDNHVCYLLRAVVKQYLSVRFTYWGKNVIKKGESLRQMYTKLILFRGE